MRKRNKSVFGLSLFLATNVAYSQAVPTPANDTVTPPTTQQTEARPVDANMTVMTDEQIVGVLKLANDGEIKAAKNAVKHAQAKEVKQFAKGMIKDHGTANQELKGIKSKDKLKEADSELKRTLQASAKSGEERLKGLKGRDFDRAYMEEQITMHQAVLNAIDSDLLPNANNADLKAHLEKVRPIVAKHLDHAKSLETSNTAVR